ncbi:hypothetical protein SOVF_010890, partial [Spinacia oleracea]
NKVQVPEVQTEVYHVAWPDQEKEYVPETEFVLSTEKVNDQPFPQGVSSLCSLAIENDKGVHIVAVGEVAIIKFSAEYRKDIPKIKKNPFIKWQKIECPRQPPGSKESGYYVGRYMIETIALRQMFIREKTMLFLLLRCCYAAVPAADSDVPAAGAAVAGEFVRCCC